MLHSTLGKGDLLVGDRAFCAYAHLAVLSAREVLALFRLHASRIVSFQMDRQGRRPRRHRRRGQPHSTLVKRLGPDDQLVRWRKPRD